MKSLSKSRARLSTAAEGNRPNRRSRAVALAALTAAACTTLATVAVQGAAVAGSDDGHGHHRAAFRQVNLVSDVPGMARLLDPEVKNPWGIAFGPDTPLWVNNEFNPALATCGPCTPEDLLTKITLYAGANGEDPFTKLPLEVEASSPTGIVFNPTEDFVIRQGGVRTPARFIFDELFFGAEPDASDSRVTAWSNVPAPPVTTTHTRAFKPDSFHAGLALVPGEGRRPSRLVVADAQNGTLDVYGRAFQEAHAGLFVEPNAASEGLAPYNATYLDGRVYVAYAGETTGAISVFKPSGRFEMRLVTSSRLAGPWGMAIAPRKWGHFGRALLVGNVDDGRINAFDRHTGRFLGTLRDRHGDPLVNPGLWGIQFGNGVIGTPRTLIFAAGIGEEVGGFGDEIYEHGLVGLIKPVHRHHH